MAGKTTTVLELFFSPPKAGEKGESKNYDILEMPNADGKCPALIGNNGRLYLRKGLVNPATVKKVTLTFTVE